MFFSVVSSLQQRLRQQVETVSSGLRPWSPGLLLELLSSGCQLRAGSLGPSPSCLLFRAPPALPGSRVSSQFRVPLSCLVGEEQSAPSLALPKPLLGAR